MGVVYGRRSSNVSSPRFMIQKPELSTSSTDAIWLLKSLKLGCTQHLLLVIEYSLDKIHVPES